MLRQPGWIDVGARGNAFWILRLCNALDGWVFLVYNMEELRNVVSVTD